MTTPARRFVAALALAGSVLLGTGAVSAPVAGAAAAASTSTVAVARTVTPGAFCKTAEIGQTGYSKNGVKMVCSTAKGDSRARWREVVK